MKKLLVLSLAVVMVVAFTLPASAFESVFGGYWRVRAFSQQNFSGNSDLGRDTADALGAPGDLSRTDTRTRLYYTAVLNDNVKFVNQFEFDANFGDGGDQYGDIGADGVAVEIRSSHVDATMGPIRMTLGVQPLELARGHIISDQMAGVILSTKMGEHLLPFTWFKVNEGGTDLNSEDSDVFAFFPVFNFGDNFNINPYVAYGYSKDGVRNGANIFSTYGQNGATAGFVNDDGISVYWVGATVNATLGSFNLWANGTYVGGEISTNVAGQDNMDVKAFVASFGGNVPLGPASLHGQVVYASGDDDPDDSDFEAYFGVDGAGAGWSYYWAEIMGNGRFDAQSSQGASANPSNLWFVNIGASIKPMEKLKLTGDLYYAALPENDVNGEDVLGLEVDLVATYQLVEGLSIDLVGAYLFADDAVSVDGQNEDDPWEVGTRLQISF
jgi:hypothetical protein